MSVILNETKQAEHIIASGDIGTKPAATLFLLGKYYRQKQHLNKQQTFLKLSEFMKEHYKNYHAASWENIIEDIAQKAGKYPLREIDAIDISREEFKEISTLKNIKYEKLLFTMLCYAKLYNMVSEKNNGWVNTSIPELFRNARVTVKYKEDKFLYLNDIEKTGLISFSNKNDNLNLKVNFINSRSESVLALNDLREPGYEYLNFIGKMKFVRCFECNRLTIQSGKNTHYCSTCKHLKRLESKRNWWLKNN